MKKTLTYAELSTILAALRLWQGGEVEVIRDTYFYDAEELGAYDIDSLCERLSCGEIVTIEGGPKE